MPMKRTLRRENQELARENASLKASNEQLRHRLDNKTRQDKAKAETGGRIATDLITRTRERDTAIRELAAAEKIIITLRQRPAAQPGDRTLLGCAGCGGPDCACPSTPAITTGEVTS